MPSTLLRKRARLATLAAAAQAVSTRRPEVAIETIDHWTIRSGPDAATRLIVAVRSNGATGYGETAGSAAPDLERHRASLLGRDALATVNFSAVPERIRGAVDMALLDLKGKLFQAPVYDLLSGRTREKARAMAAISGADEAQLTEGVAAAREAGFRAFSVPVQLPRDTPTRGRRFFADTQGLLERLRQAGADDLALDCGGRTTAAEGATLAARLEGFHLMWLDEPAGRINDEALKKISHDSVTPVGWGRRFTNNSRFQDLLRLQVVDVLRPDVGTSGITNVRKAAALAEAYYTAIAPFHRGGPIGAAAALQVAASTPNFVVQEVAFSTERMHRDIASELEVVDGFFELPTGPGLGIEVDESALRRYAV